MNNLIGCRKKSKVKSKPTAFNNYNNYNDNEKLFDWEKKLEEIFRWKTEYKCSECSETIDIVNFDYLGYPVCKTCNSKIISRNVIEKYLKINQRKPSDTIYC